MIYFCSLSLVSNKEFFIISETRLQMRKMEQHSSTVMDEPGFVRLYWITPAQPLQDRLLQPYICCNIMSQQFSRIRPLVRPSATILKNNFFIVSHSSM